MSAALESPREFFDALFCAVTKTVTPMPTFEDVSAASLETEPRHLCEKVREIEVPAPWLPLLKSAFPEWTSTWEDWEIVTPAGTPPWLVTVTRELPNGFHVVHFAIPSENTWRTWVDEFTPAVFTQASVALLEFALQNKWQEASQLPVLISRWRTGALPVDFWSSLAMFAHEGMDPEPATVASCRL